MVGIRTVLRLGLCISAIMIADAASADSPAAMTDDFCARLARNSGIDKPTATEGHTTWTVNALNFGQRFVVGGSAATGIGVKPIEPATLADYHRIEDMCNPEGKGGVCKLVGPLDFKFTWKGSTTMTPMPSGERATVTVMGIKTTCRSEGALTTAPTLVSHDHR